MKTCDMCVNFEEGAFGDGICDAMRNLLHRYGMPSGKACVSGGSDASACGDFEMSSRGLDLCEEYGIEPGSDFPATLHAGADVPRRVMR